MDFGLIVTVVWAVASAAVWGLVFRDSLDSLHRYRDRRAKREVIWAFALFLVGFLACLSILALVISPDGRGIRAFMAAIALGAFLGAGIVVKTLSGKDNESRR